MTAWARPGAECVCVCAQWKRGPGISVLRWLRLKFLGLPIVGGKYVVAEVGGHQVRLRGFGPLWFHAVNFRPLTKHSLEQDVGLFVHHLKKVMAPADAAR